MLDMRGLSLSAAEHAALASSAAASPGGETETAEAQAHASCRSANLKFPPRDSGLKIPRTLFLVTGSGGSSAGVRGEGAGKGERSEGAVKRGTRGREHGSGSAGDDEMGEQAREIVRLMRRSVVRHEFKERVMWDEDADPHAAAEERVQLVSLKEKEEEEVGEGEGEEEKALGEWLEGGDY